jgi:hypothetical protein
VMSKMAWVADMGDPLVLRIQRRVRCCATDKQKSSGYSRAG